MQRYTGQPLGQSPHVAVLFYDAIGDFVVATPLLRGLREQFPGCVVDYFGGERTRELEEASLLIDARFSVFGLEDLFVTLPTFRDSRRVAAGDYDLAINCDDHPALALVAGGLGARFVVGRCYDAQRRADLPPSFERVDGLRDESWDSPTLLERYGNVLHSQFIGEILCRLARVETDFARTEVPIAEPPIAVPPVLISTGGKRGAKLWAREHWRALLMGCAERGLLVGLLGDRPVSQRERYHSGDDEEYLLAQAPLIDLRGQLSLPQVAGALAKARACVTIDNGIMHLAGAVGVPTLALFGASAWRVWALPRPSLRVLLGTQRCMLCEENRFRNSGCLRDQHVCMDSLEPATVLAQLDALLADGQGARDLSERWG
ncbi:MAG: glycosyltransferase family 9 protein [Chloroflexota bacterium]